MRYNNIVCLSNLLILSLPGESHFINMMYILHLIFTFMIQQRQKKPSLLFSSSTQEIRPGQQIVCSHSEWYLHQILIRSNYITNPNISTYQWLSCLNYHNCLSLQDYYLYMLWILCSHLSLKQIKYNSWGNRINVPLNDCIHSVMQLIKNQILSSHVLF